MIKHSKRESFDEYRLGRLQVQFFEFKLWALGVKLAVQKDGWAIALPSMAIRWTGCLLGAGNA